MVISVVMLGISAGPAVAAATIPAPKDVCAVSDSRIGELSGLVSDGQQWYAINDGGTKVEIFVLARNCAVRRVITNKTDPYDVEDLARTSDGTLWLSDTGDNRKQRETVALHAVSLDGKETLYRFTYPDGAHDVEALILGRDSVPYFVTKDLLGRSGIYRPTEKLASPGPTTLQRVGELSMKSTDTPGGPVGSFGSVLITGAAMSVDGSVIALRTYTDAYLYPVVNGDVLAALRTEPVRVPLPNEKQGEAIAFEPDGTLLSGSEGVGEPIRAIPNAVSLVSSSGTGNSGDSASSEAQSSDSRSSPLSGVLPEVLIIVAVIAGLGFLVKRFRRE
jgi:hypothetical protein